MLKKQTDLHPRLAKALQEPSSVSSAEVAELLEAAKAEIATAEEAVKNARVAALDVSLTQAQVEAQHDAVSKARFNLERWTHWSGELAKLFDIRAAEEAVEAKRKVLSASEAVRDACAERIRKEYPAIQAALLSLIGDIAQARAAVLAANADLPDGAEPLHMPEGVAFGYPDTPKKRLVGARPAQISEMLVPNFKDYAKPAWPPNWSGLARGRLTEWEIDSLLSAALADGLLKVTQK